MAERPLDLATALSKDSPAQPGDTIWVHGGTYLGSFVSHLKGVPGAPIVVRARRGERATIDNGPTGRDALEALGAWTWFWGLEITSSATQRYTTESGSWPSDLHRGSGVTARGAYLKFINMVIHDAATGLGVWEEAIGTEVYGNLVYFNGWYAPDRGHGHGIYTQNAGPVIRHIRDNILFEQFSHGIHAFGSAAARLNQITLDGNVSFNNGRLSGDFSRDILLGGGRQAIDPLVTHNFTYGGAQTNIGYSAGCANAKVLDNYFVGASMLVNCDAIVARNTIIVSDGLNELRARFPDNDYHDQQGKGVGIQVRRNAYEPHRAHVVVYNWRKSEYVEVDISSVCTYPHDRYEVFDAQNFYAAPVVSGNCGSGLAKLPMMGLHVATPVGEVPTQPRHTAPEFAVFVVIGQANNDDGHCSPRARNLTDADRRPLKSLQRFRKR